MCNAFLHTKLADQLETWRFFDSGLNASNTVADNCGTDVRCHIYCTGIQKSSTGNISHWEMNLMLTRSKNSYGKGINSWS